MKNKLFILKNGVPVEERDEKKWHEFMSNLKNTYLTESDFSVHGVRFNVRTQFMGERLSMGLFQTFAVRYRPTGEPQDCVIVSGSDTARESLAEHQTMMACLESLSEEQVLSPFMLQDEWHDFLIESRR